MTMTEPVLAPEPEQPAPPTAPEPPAPGRRRVRRDPRAGLATGLAGMRTRVNTLRPAPGQRPTGTVTSVTSVFTMLALVCLWVVVQLLWLGNVAQQRDQDLLYREFRTQVASGTAPVGPITEPGEPVALLRIPALDVEQVVVEGTASGDLLAGPGHLRSTVLPGQLGSSVVMGRAATYGAPFADLTSLVPGDTIEVVIAQGTVRFTVLDVRRTGDPFPQPRAADAARLTLVTAEGDGRLSGLSPDEAVYVDAEATRGAFPAPAGLPRVAPASEQVMASDTAALPLLTVCLAALLGLTLLVVAARQRWSAVLVWIVAAPVAIALAWATTEVGVRLLPNLL